MNRHRKTHLLTTGYRKAIQCLRDAAAARREGRYCSQHSSRHLADHTQDRLADIVLTTVDRKTAGAQRTSLFGCCGSITGIGVFALDCRDGRGVQVYLPANYLISVTANKVPSTRPPTAVAEHAETIAAAKVTADELS